MAVVSLLSYFSALLFNIRLSHSTNVEFTPVNTANEYGELMSLDVNTQVLSTGEDDEEEMEVFQISSSSSGMEIQLNDHMVDTNYNFEVKFNSITSGNDVSVNIDEDLKTIYVSCHSDDDCLISAVRVDFIPMGGMNKPSDYYFNEHKRATEGGDPDSPNRRRLPTVGTTIPTKWSCPIPYTFDSSLTVSHSDIIEGMNYISQKTGWTFVPRTSQTDYITFFAGGGCYSNIGRIGGQQWISIEAGCGFGAIVHEIGHAIGLHHEHVRLDRDTYVYITQSNIDPSFYDANFPISDIINYCDYDYNSIMHYGKYAFAIDGRFQTVTPINDLSDVCYVGQRFMLSFEDVENYNKQLAGNIHCSTSSPPECDSSDIVVCGASSNVNAFEPNFQEYEEFDIYNGKQRYRSRRSIFNLYSYIYWYSFSNIWIIDFNGGIYAYSYENNLFDTTGHWYHYHFGYGTYVFDSAISVAPIECEDECLTETDDLGCTSCDYEYELEFVESCDKFKCVAETCGPAPSVCDIRDEVDSRHCPIPCDHFPCHCNDECQFCKVCHSNGCDQCQDGYFKKNYNYPCIHCQEYFGDGCMFCQDHNGCGQCKTGYTRTYNNDCGLWECR